MEVERCLLGARRPVPGHGDLSAQRGPIAAHTCGVDIDLIRPLYTQPPAGFVEARSAAVKALKAEGHKEEAAAVAKLRRPKVAEYALNHAVDSDPQLADHWARAVAATEDAQAMAIGSSTAGRLRDQLNELRAATAALLAAAVDGLGEDGEAQRAAIADLLRTLTHRAGAAQVLAAVVGSEQIVPEDLFAGAAMPATDSPRAARPSRTARAKEPKVAGEPSAAAPRVTAEEKAKAAALAKERARVRRGAERAVADAQRRMSAAQAAATDLRDRLEAATQELDDARRDAAAAEEALEQLRD